MTRWMRTSAVGVVLVLSACTPGAPSAPATGAIPSGLQAASSGLCDALAALPDASAAARAFTNEAHEPLHRLAADPRLARPMSARVLEAMQKVEGDFARSADLTALAGDLAALRASADAAFETLGVDVPSCEP